MKKLMKFIKAEIILCVSIVLAFASMFVIKPDAQYMSYVDWHTLILLFCLMAVMAGFQKLKFFQNIGMMLLSYVKNSRELMLILVFLPFFFSMLITNDVALITFVPFALVILRMAKQEKLVVAVIVLQTIAANLGSMLTPIGNPQNLYLYAKSGMRLMDFVMLLLPYTLLSALGLFVMIVIHKPVALDATVLQNRNAEVMDQKGLLIYIGMFMLCLLSIAKVLEPIYLMGIICIVLWIVDREIFKLVDYTLLGTFIGFFVFIGNMGRMESFRQMLESVMAGQEVMVAVLSSQVISNVPAALLLSGFTNKWDALIIGTNLGGLGTLIASMASLISFKQIAKQYPSQKGRYFTYFTVGNVIMLFILLGAHMYF